MATTTPNDSSTTTSKSVDASLWWDPFPQLLTELEDASSLSSSDDLPISLVNKLKDNRVWLLETVSQFKSPNEKSKEALESQQVKIGSHQLTVKPELKDAALRISSALCLDEVQSYILVERSIESNAVELDPVVLEPLHLVMLQYYVERQCLLKCTRQIFTNALYAGAGSTEGSAMRQEALKLVSDGLETRLLSVLQVLLSSSYPEHMDVDLFPLWAEEILVEDNLLLDILFLAYYESFCTCDGKEWKKLCLLYEGMISGSCNFRKLAVSSEVVQSIYHAKVQMLLILIETLNLENLLQMIHDEMPFRQGTVSFSMTDIQETDAIISSFDAFEMKEAGPLILTWAVFLCLISSLPKELEHSVLTEIDHVGYVRQAFGAASLNYFLEILQSNVLKDSDGPTDGFRSVLRTFISAFIASYEISLQLENSNLKLILDILGQIYRGEESLCIQFWDKDSFIDGPIRCLLCSLEGEFPYRTLELVRLLSALSEGTWPAACVYNFLQKSVGLSSLFEISGNSVLDNYSRIVETQLPLRVPGLEGLLIPSKTRGHVLRMINERTGVVRWEYAQSGLLVLLLRLSQEIYPDGSEEVLATLDLLGRLVSFNEGVCYSMMEIGNSIQGKDGMNGYIKECRVNLVEIICNLIKNLSPSCNGALMMSMGVNILAMMLKCTPSHVTSMVLKTNIFDVALRMNSFGADHLSSGSWLLSGRLAKMLLIDSEQNNSCYPLAESVLEFTIQLVDTGVQNDFVLALVIFSVQYILVNHEYWKFKARHLRWKVTLKVLDVMKKCILAIPHAEKLGHVVRDLLLCDSSIHSALFRIVCITTPTLEKFYVSRLYELVEIEGVQLAVCSALDILFSMLSELSKDNLPAVPVFHQAVLSSTTKPVPVFTALISLISCFRNPKIQAAAARALSVLFFTAEYLQPLVSGNACFALDEKEVTGFRTSVNAILREQSLNEDLIVNTFKMLASAAHFQPAFLVTVIGANENIREVSFGSLGSKEENLLDAVKEYVGKSAEIIKSHPNILLNVLNFMKALWQGAGQFLNILEWLKNSENFWRQVSSVLLIGGMEDTSSGPLSKTAFLNSAYRYQCQSDVLQIMAYEIFLQKKVLHAEVGANQTSKSAKDNAEKAKDVSLCGPKDILSTWCRNSVLCNLIKLYVSFEYNSIKYHKAKVAAALFCVHVMAKLGSDDSGSLSVSILERISILSEKLSNLPAFSELLSQYKQRGYCDGKASNALVLSDLYYHMQGEFEGRKIDHGLFQELFLFLLESKFLENYILKYEGDLSLQAKDIFLFDCDRLRADMGIDMWDFSDWKTSKAVAETMLLYLQDLNSMVLLTNTKISALKALTTILPVYDEESLERKATIGQKLTEQQRSSCIDQICQGLNATLQSLLPGCDAGEYVLHSLAAQAELLFHFIRSIDNRLSVPTCILILKTSGAGLKVVSDTKSSVAAFMLIMKLLLRVLLLALELSCINSPAVEVTDGEPLEAYAEASTVSLGLLPILCNCIEPSDLCTLSLTCTDLILKGFLTPTTWFPIMQKHFNVQLVMKKLQDKNSHASVSIILKFFLTLAHVRGGAEMLVNAGFFESLRGLFSNSPDGSPSSVIQGEKDLLFSNLSEKGEKPQHIWGLCLAVVTAIVQSLGDGSSYSDVVDYVISCLFLEKSYLVFYYLNTLDFPSSVYDKKRARTQKMPTSLNALKETQNTLILICILAKHRNSWNKGMKDMEAQLRERSIHLLAFISRGTQLLGESSRGPPLLCHPILKQEFEWYKKPSFVNSKNGWFSLSPLACGLNPQFSTLSSKTTAPSTENIEVAPQTCFSDTAATEIYRIAFYLLHFLCLQADAATRRAEEVGFVDAANFPELPMPDILHGLQDQGITIVHELCEANKLKQVPSEIRAVCILLLQITEMALYLEFCVSQICGIRPVMGRVEDFSKEFKLLLRATEGHAFLKESVKSLKQITSFAYPGLLHNEGF